MEQKEAQNSQVLVACISVSGFCRCCYVVQGPKWKGQSRVKAILALNHMEGAQFLFCSNSLVQ